ncbi:12879_t:CDS:2 [Gigaspora margarita]|uniref:12879_t:CDS:1 n=1 Tax=Gigaspora margarita TaxID=4874 RepID=A0ABN7UEA0_GIGMA|nr:12879_t:CDS:2 [Gigaspora margarita]
MHEKIHGCNPSDDDGPSCSILHLPCNKTQITKATWYPGILEITVDTTDKAPQAFGHFTFADDDGHNITPQKGV